MATSNKDFKVKNGLIVEGTSATVDGNDVLTTVSSIGDLSDVDTSGILNGQVLVYDDNLLSWVPGSRSGESGVDFLASVGDVEVYDLADGDVLVYSSAIDRWINSQDFQSSSITVSETPPDFPFPSGGDGWFNSNDGTLYIYYEDYDSGQWIQVAGTKGAKGNPGESGSTGPTGPMGPQGFTGNTGETGPQGPAGLTGPAGQNGVDGLGYGYEPLDNSSSTDYVNTWLPGETKQLGFGKIGAYKVGDFVKWTSNTDLETYVYGTITSLTPSPSEGVVIEVYEVSLGLGVENGVVSYPISTPGSTLSIAGIPGTPGATGATGSVGAIDDLTDVDSSRIIRAPNYEIDVTTQTNPTILAISFNSGTGLIDVSTNTELSITGSNYSPGAIKTVKIFNSAITNLNLFFPGNWIFVGEKPTEIIAQKTAILTVTSFTSSDTGCVAAYVEEA